MKNKKGHKIRRHITFGLVIHVNGELTVIWYISLFVYLKYYFIITLFFSFWARVKLKPCFTHHVYLRKKVKRPLPRIYMHITGYRLSYMYRNETVWVWCTDRQPIRERERERGPERLVETDRQKWKEPHGRPILLLHTRIYALGKMKIKSTKS